MFNGNGHNSGRGAKDYSKVSLDDFSDDDTDDDEGDFVQHSIKNQQVKIA